MVPLAPLDKMVPVEYLGRNKDEAQKLNVAQENISLDTLKLESYTK